jgi:hypothetical protein
MNSPPLRRVFKDELILSSELTKAIRDDTEYDILGRRPVTGRTKLARSAHLTKPGHSMQRL